MTDGATTTTYDYGMFGELRAVDDGTAAIEYEHDAFGRSVGKRVDGTLTQAFIYQDQLNPVAELRPDGSVLSRFVYGTRAHVPDFMIQGATTYAFLTDHLGSVRYVVDTATGVIAQRLEYDEFGQVLSDSNPGFQPFGFAGGLYDADTGLVRFGVRDYDPNVGRWTARDPIGFAGAQANLYVYARSSPQSFVDPSGQLAWFTPVVLPGFIAGAANWFANSDENESGQARAFLAGATGGMVAGVVGTGAGLLGAGIMATGFAATAAGGALTKAANLSSCLDAPRWGYWKDVAFYGVVAGALGAATGGGASLLPGTTTSFVGGTETLKGIGIAIAEAGSNLGAIAEGKADPTWDGIQ